MKKVLSIITSVLLFIILLNVSIPAQAKIQPDMCTNSSPAASSNSLRIQPECDDGVAEWMEIRSTAFFTNSTNHVNNYEKMGGSSKALSDFDKMPGTIKKLEAGRRIKTHNGKTVTYYPKSTSTGYPSLQYPATNGRLWDKIRYK